MTFKSAGTGLSRNLLLVRLKEKTSSHEICPFFLLYLLLFLVLWPHSRGRPNRRYHHQEPSNVAAPYRVKGCEQFFFKKPKQTSCLLACCADNINLPNSTVWKTIYGICYWGVTCNHAKPVCCPQGVCTTTAWQLIWANIRLQDKRRAVCFVLFVQC